ncbi:hypothetical protein SAMN04489747_0464 [Auraticoccus monumenti]|uniref:Uncharacterized protein n=2 Tax=Auraticoccus monumenti TaxID=675864 RepID=A0A1G6SXQ0_9ACTN|nr:hypothetical protein SAMN04489747_0464 [Auraticoccus monumenti]
MVAGVVVLLVALPLITLPLALALGVRHLRRYLLAESHGVGEVLADLRQGVLGSLLVGLVTLLLGTALALDVALGTAGVLPGGRVVVVAGWVGLAVLGTVLVVAARAWSPATGWRAALRAVPQELGTDPVGACYVAVAVGFVALLTWQLPPLVLPGLGLLVFASLAVPERLLARG